MCKAPRQEATQCICGIEGWETCGAGTLCGREGVVKWSAADIGRALRAILGVVEGFKQGRDMVRFTCLGPREAE